jgi:hypothetical protein
LLSTGCGSSFKPDDPAAQKAVDALKKLGGKITMTKSSGVVEMSGERGGRGEDFTTTKRKVYDLAVDLSGTAAADEDLESLGPLKVTRTDDATYRLSSVNLTNTKVTKRGIEKLSKALPGVTITS